MRNKYYITYSYLNAGGNQLSGCAEIEHKPFQNATEIIAVANELSSSIIRSVIITNIIKLPI